MENKETLEKEAVNYYNQIKSSVFPRPVMEKLLEVFVNWLEQRFSDRGKQEIEAMLIGTLPDLRETQSGKDLIHIGKLEGKIEVLLLRLNAKFRHLPDQLRKAIISLESEEKLDRLHLQIMTIDSLDQLTL